MTGRAEALALQHVHYMPEELAAGVLYVSREFDVAIHLCACGCGAKVVTPIGAGGWSFEEPTEGPSLSPSIGSWQIPCRSHYFLTRGRVEWL